MFTLDLAPVPRRLDLDRLERWEEPSASLGHDCTTEICNACSTRGHAREPGILLRARLAASVRVRPVTVARHEGLLGRLPLARRVSEERPTSFSRPGSFGVGASCARAFLGERARPVKAVR
jgi:hypothetical protein